MSECIHPAMNAEQSNATQAVNDNEINNNYPTNKPVVQTVKNGAKSRGQDTENVLETYSAMQRHEQRMKKIDKKLKTKMRLEQARFGWRNLELEMQMKKLEIKHQLIEGERELERKVKRTVLESEDVRSQSTISRDIKFQLDPKEERYLRLGQKDRQPSNPRSINSSLQSNP